MSPDREEEQSPEARDQRHRMAHADKLRARRRERYLANREKVLAQVRGLQEWQTEEKLLAYAAANQERPGSKEQRNAYNRAYHAANREKRLAYMCLIGLPAARQTSPQ